MNESHDHDPHDSHDGHAHGNEADQGIKAMFRYARFARDMWRSEVNDAVVERVDPRRGENVVDIGAGVGAGAVVAAKRGAVVRAIEPTPYMRRILSVRRLWQRARKQITVVDGAAEATGLPDGVAEAVWAVNTMHHWTDVERAAVELARIVAPGGRLVLADEDFDDTTHPDYERFTARHGDEHSHSFHMVDPAAMADKLTAAGLVVTTARTERIVGRPVILIEATRPR